jgi:hypothetical protein
LYFSTGITAVSKSRRMIWIEHVARTGERTKAYRVVAGKPDRKRHHENASIDGRITLK